MITFTVPYSIIHAQRDAFIQPGITVNIVIDTLEIDLRIFIDFTKKQQSFLVSLSDSVINIESFPDFISTLYTIYTLSDRLVLNRKVMPVIYTGQTVSLVNRKALETFFHSQGEDHFSLMYIQQQADTDCYIQLLDLNTLETFNEKTFEFYINNTIEHLFITAQAPFVLADQIIRLYDIVKSNKYVELTFELVELQRLNSYHSNCANFWKERAALYQSFISLSKQVGEGEYYEIKRWYEQEYEVLPLWYKRVGHIIKVITGKRSFKSFFKNN